MTELNNTILVVDDEYLIAMGFCTQVEEMGHSVCGMASTADEAVALSQRHRPALVLMDMRLRGERDGVDAALAIYESVGSEVIFMTGSREPATIARIQLDHPSAVLFKPVSYQQLRTAIEAAMAT